MLLHLRDEVLKEFCMDWAVFILTHAGSNVHLGWLQLINDPVNVVETHASANQSSHVVNGNHLSQYFHICFYFVDSSLGKHSSDLMSLQCLISLN